MFKHKLKSSEPRLTIRYYESRSVGTHILKNIGYTDTDLVNLFTTGEMKDWDEVEKKKFQIRLSMNLNQL